MNLRARIVYEDNTEIDSFMYANSHFGNRLPGDIYEVFSVRHLYNIRDYLEGDFVQRADIDMSTLGLDGNFAPIYPAFEGTFNATYGANSQRRINNLVIDTLSSENIGLFSEVSGNVIGVSLFGPADDADNVNLPRIHAPNAANVGAIAGVLRDGGTISRSNSFMNVTGGTGNTGGLIGRIDTGSSLTYSFNAGFFNTHLEGMVPPAVPPRTANGTESMVRVDAPATDSSNGTNGASGTNGANGADEPVGSVAIRLVRPSNALGTGSVVARGGNIGGLVGSNSGRIHMSFNNARVNVEDVGLIGAFNYSTAPIITRLDSGVLTHLGGIAGENAGNIARSYATNFVAIYGGNPFAFSGGIAGTGSGAITGSHFISNGTPNVGTAPGNFNMAMTKTELSNHPFTYGEVTFETDSGALGRYQDENFEPKNTYFSYPFPLLGNNMPELILNSGWGWEDIEPIIMSSTG